MDVSRHRRFNSRQGISLLVVIVVILGIGEAIARWGFGLGDPPLLMDDPEIEYLFKPGTYHRFGNLIHYNQWSMRSDDFPREKSDPTEIRIMVIGDSVANGGSLTDQSEVATTLLQEKLRRDLGKKVIVGNISAGGWAPYNELAYLRKYGLFEADLVVIILSSHDYAYIPTFAPRAGKDPNLPDQSPLFALQEAFTRYLPRHLGNALKKESSPSDTTADVDEAIEKSMKALRELVTLARDAGAEVLLAQHLERDEIIGEKRPGYEAIRLLADDMDVTRIDLGSSFAVAMKDNGQNLYNDFIHPNVAGQKLIADTLLNPIKQSLSEGTHPAAQDQQGATH